MTKLLLKRKLSVLIHSRSGEVWKNGKIYHHTCLDIHLGEVVGYIGSALTGGTYNAMETSIISMLIGTIGAVLIYVISKDATTSPENGATNKN